MRGSVYSLEHFLQVVLGESWVTFDAIFKIVVLQTEGFFKLFHSHTQTMQLILILQYNYIHTRI